MRKSFTIDGVNFSSLSGFFDEFSRVMKPYDWWGRNLDAFIDVLRGGIGTPDEGYVLIWKNSDISRERLGHGETVKELERRLTRVHSSNVSSVQRQIDLARRGDGETVLDWLVDSIQTEGKNIELRLE